MGKKTERLKGARKLKASSEFEALIAEAMPSPHARRTKKMLLVSTDEEYRRVKAYAKLKSEPPSTVVRKLTLAVLENLGVK